MYARRIDRLQPFGRRAILRKDMEAVVITPVNPHTLNEPPRGRFGDRVYELEVIDPHPETSAMVDGRLLCRLERGDRIRVTLWLVRFKMVVPPGHSYYRTLCEKLNWGGSFREGITRSASDES